MKNKKHLTSPLKGLSRLEQSSQIKIDEIIENWLFPSSFFFQNAILENSVIEYLSKTQNIIEEHF